VTDGLAVDLRVRLATPEEANNLVTMAKQQTSNPQVKNMFDKLDIGSDGSDVKVNLAMSQQKLMALVGLVGGALGGMLGGGGGGMGAP
jgi:phage-related minor tail protein